MWNPTHIVVTVQRAKGLLTKGKNGTNNCFVTIGLGKEKYQTSVKSHAGPNVDWNEECELKIPDQGNRAELTLTCLHQTKIGIDEFLGQVRLPLNEMDVYDRPRSKTFKLESKPGKEKKNKERGDLEVRFSFIVKSGSLSDLSKKEKHKSSIDQISSTVGGSLLSLSKKGKGMKKFASSLMHLPSKKKPKDGDDVSINGSFASLGRPNSFNGDSPRYDPRDIHEYEEDDVGFDNLSHKSSGTSLNVNSGLQPPTRNFEPRNPSPLLRNGKAGGKQLSSNYIEEDVVVDPELEENENDFSVRARTLPAPSKPPRTPQLDNTEGQKEPKLDEWEKKLYGNHMQPGSSDSLKRRSWETARVPLPTTNEEIIDKAENEQLETKTAAITEKSKAFKEIETTTDTESSTDSEEEEVPEPFKVEKVAEPKVFAPAKVENEYSESTPKVVPLRRPQELNLNGSSSPTIKPRQVNLLSPEIEKNDFDELNASFAKFEQKNKEKIFVDDDRKWKTQAFIAQESEAPQAQPRNRTAEVDIRKSQEEEARKRREAEENELKQQEAQRRRAEEDARLEAQLRLDEQRLREEEQALQEELRAQDEQKRREAKRREEDQRILNFAKRSTSQEDDSHGFGTTPEQSPKERIPEKREKRLSKFKYFSKRDKNEDDSSSSSPRSNERIIIGHEKGTTHAERRSEITAALAKKYDGKSREELMLIANGMENEALIQRQRVKELEDYLDNLLLRVMETHPKILQNPYSRTTSAKSFKNYINMNDFL